MGSLIQVPFSQNGEKARIWVKVSLDFNKMTFIEGKLVMDWIGIDHNAKYGGQNNCLDTCTSTHCNNIEPQSMLVKVEDDVEQLV